MAEDYWEHDSTYRGIEIQRWMPGAIAYGAWINGDWTVKVSKNDLKGLIDDWLGPEEPEEEPYTTINSFTIPPSLPAGTPIGELTIVAKNTGTGRGYLAVYINSERYTETAETSPTKIAVGGTFTFHLTLQITTNMPNEDFTLTALNDNGASTITKTISLTPLAEFTFTVTDQTTGQPLQGANCSLRAALNCTGDAVTALTDASGIAILSAVWFVPRSWGVSKTGYTPTCSNNVTPQITAALELQLPNPQIKNVTYPPTATPAQEVTITWTVQNQGETTPHLQWTSLIDDDTDEPLHSEAFTLPAGEQTEVSATLLMPDRTWNLRIDAGYHDVVTASKSLRVGDGAVSLLPVAAVGLFAYLVLKKK